MQLRATVGRTARAIALLVVAGGSARAADANDTKSSSGGTPLTTKASTEVSGYADSDHVTVLTPSIAARIGDDVEGWSVGGRYLVDVVSAASVDIVSTASAQWHEVRHAGSADATARFGDVTPTITGIISSEPDYFSVAGGATLALDVLDKNLTPFVGLSYGDDQVGRTDLPRQYWREKQTVSAQLGATFVVDRSTIASLQADGIVESGYLAKPYRYVPLFSAAQAVTIQPGASIAQVNSARLDVRPAEQVPNARHRFALTGRLAHRFDQSTLRIDERAYADSWGLLASTTELRLLVDVGRRWTVWPHARFHVQNDVTFWQRAYVAPTGAGGAIGVPALRTGDRELSALSTATAGGGVRFLLVDDLRQPWSIVFEVDGSYTRYFDALYISERAAIFSTLAVETQF